MAVSGPGALSQRTDTGGQPIRELPNPDYGEATEYREQQKGAPLAETPRIPTPSVPAASGNAAPPSQNPPRPVTPLFGASMRPDEPITAGVPIGPGPNQLASQPAPEAYTLSAQLSNYATADTSGALAWLANVLHSQGQ